MTRTEDVKAALDETIETFGRLDAAFNNAGVENEVKPMADVTEEEWDRIVAINLRGVRGVKARRQPRGGRRPRDATHDD